jgi:2-keto-4-pentenoate hydratase/2-oxohepta-3-ene-1,7-dioic acid hydratase in catechol pathway
VKLVSFLDDGQPVLGILIDDRVIKASGLGDGVPRSMADLLLDSAGGLSRLRAAVAQRGAVREMGVPISEVVVLAPVERPGKIVAIGRNYREHAAEEGTDVPAQPLMFAKFPSSLVPDGADITWDPAVTTQVDYEAEIAVVIGRTARNVTADQAPDHVLGYTCLNDVSARDVQFGDGQWTRGKSLDSFCPIGPVLTTGDEIANPQALEIRCLLNGVVMQSASTSQMYFSIAELIAYCSSNFTLEVGDVIATGTPGGVGVFRDPPVFLQDGDEVIVEVEGIGRLRNRCRVATGALTLVR